MTAIAMSQVDPKVAPGHAVILQPRDGLIARDARPFSANPGAQARTYDFPPPSTVAGALRTHIGNEQAFVWSDPKDGPAKALQISIRGPLLVARDGDDGDWTVYLRAPLDAVPLGDPPDTSVPTRFMVLRPGARTATPTTDLPSDALTEVGVTKDAKPAGDVEFWPWDAVQTWLATDPPTVTPSDRFRPGLKRHTRVRVGIDRATQTNADGALFATEALVFSDAGGRHGQTALLVGIDTAESWRPATTALPLGGERRIARLEPAAEAWPMPDNTALASLAAAINSAGGMRLLLATPAVFSQGWLPGWLDEATLIGKPPPVDGQGVTLRLAGAAVGRRLAVSGWDMQARGPKATRWLAPAGSVYFFEIAAGKVTPDWLKRLWLAPVSDDDQSQRDGFGLCLPGLWNAPKGQTTP